jgi:hypothetical protein
MEVAAAAAVGGAIALLESSMIVGLLGQGQRVVTTRGHNQMREKSGIMSFYW